MCLMSPLIYFHYLTIITYFAEVWLCQTLLRAFSRRGRAVLLSVALLQGLISSWMLWDVHVSGGTPDEYGTPYSARGSR